MFARSASRTTLSLIRTAAASRADSRLTARTVIAIATSARTTTAAPILTPTGRSANQPPVRPLRVSLMGVSRVVRCGRRSVGEAGDGAAQVGGHPGQLAHGGAGLRERLGGGIRGGGDPG